MELLRFAIRVGGTAYLGLALLMFLTQGRYVYFPDGEIWGTPDSRGWQYEELFLDTADGQKICAWWVPAPRARGTLLFCHGNAGNISGRLDSIDTFRGLGLNVLIFDYHGYGKSTGRPSERATYLDVAAAWEHLVSTRGIEPERIVIFGRSLGGAVAAWAATERTPGALIIESTFSSLPDIAAETYWFLPVRLLCRFRYNTRKRVRGLRCPLLVVHSRDDEMIRFEHGRRIYEAAPEPKTLLEMTGGHNAGPGASGAAYNDALDAFLTARFGPQQ